MSIEAPRDTGRRAVRLVSDTDLDGFRSACRSLVAQGVAPEQVSWGSSAAAEADLFGDATPAGVPAAAATNLRVPAAFSALCDSVVLHRDPARFGLLYRLLWRFQHEPGLRHDPLDPDRIAAARMARAVHRDMHKMKAFVRFTRIEPEPEDDGNGDGHGDGHSDRDTDRAAAAPPLHVAWFEPEHHIVDAIAPFFMRRFTQMRWAILTPERCVRWNGAQLEFGPGVGRDAAPKPDAGEALWLTYYRNIFNPARLKLKMMQKEMPKRYWKNLPEAALIAPLSAQAHQRTAAMLDNAPTVATRRRVVLFTAPVAVPTPSVALPNSLAELRAATDRCRACPIGAHATQSVFGEGPLPARLMFVGEQPGDQEDLRGRPFVGPAGQLFERGRWRVRADGLRVLITLHPSALLRTEPGERDAAYARWLDDLRQAAAFAPRPGSSPA